MKSDPHYLAICEFYGEKRAERSGVLYIRHIDEGLAILHAIDASLHAKRAYCLHPIVQADDALAKAFDDNSVIQRYQIDTYAVALAVEYRSIANAYLSHRVITEIDEIQLSPLADVQDMLIADKVQNRKDFLVHHIDSHPRADALSQYFVNWLQRLGISEFKYRELASLIDSST